MEYINDGDIPEGWDRYICDSGHITDKRTRLAGVPLLAINCSECDKKAFLDNVSNED